MHENHVAHRYIVIALASTFVIRPIPGTVRMPTSCLTRQICSPSPFTPAVIDRSKDFYRKAKQYLRTRHPSRRYDPADGPPLEKPLRGGDQSAPEHQDRVTPSNPFPTDVYYLGNLVRKYHIQVCAFPSFPPYNALTDQSRNAKVLYSWNHSLAADMVQTDPTMRPRMDEVVTRFSEIKGKLSKWKLRSRIARKNELWPVTAWKSVSHWHQTVGYALGRKAAIPERE